MGKSLTEIAQLLKDSDKKVQLIYAFNGTGKTRLSRAFKELISPKRVGDEDADSTELSGTKIIYYNAFTEDLFYWDNDLELDVKPKLKIHPNAFTKLVFLEQGNAINIINNFQHYTDEKLTPSFSSDFSEVTFSFERGNDEQEPNIKISKGEESNFIWCIFYSLLEQIVAELNIAEVSDRSTDKFNDLEYIFIDDPVSSLDENHLIELAVNISELITSSDSKLKFIISTHNPLFYNVLYNELNAKSCHLLRRDEGGIFELETKQGDSNKSFSYHLHLRKTIEEAIAQNNIQRYHFTLLRNLYEKTASFLGYSKWSQLLPEDRSAYMSRIINFTSHSTLSNEAVPEPNDQEKRIVQFLLDHLINSYGFWKGQPADV